MAGEIRFYFCRLMHKDSLCFLEEYKVKPDNLCPFYDGGK